MVFINNQFDVTLAPSGTNSNGFNSAARYTAQNSSGMSFEQASQVNRIYRGNGFICQMKMCNSITGCENPDGCQNDPNWNKIVEFCGVNSTGAMAMDGAWWQLIPADSRKQTLTATQRATGLTVLPTPYNVTGMY